MSRQDGEVEKLETTYELRHNPVPGSMQGKSLEGVCIPSTSALSLNLYLFIFCSSCIAFRIKERKVCIYFILPILRVKRSNILLLKVKNVPESVIT